MILPMLFFFFWGGLFVCMYVFDFEKIKIARNINLIFNNNNKNNNLERETQHAVFTHANSSNGVFFFFFFFFEKKNPLLSNNLCFRPITASILQ